MKIRSVDQIRERLEEIQEYCHKSYQVDNMDILLDRSGKILVYMSELPGLIADAKEIRDAKIQDILENQPGIKVTIMRFMTIRETSLIDNCKDVFSLVKNTASSLQSQMAANRIERVLNNVKNE